VRVLVGTSGYSYKPWKGRFYPEKIKDADMLAFYATRFPTVEINNTFYRMPAPALLAKWAQETATGFTFALKAPQRITHQKRLGDVADDLAYFLETAAALGDKLGPVLYQLPPYMKKDLERLRAFLGRLPPRPPAAFEFRHDSWFDEDVRAALREHGRALCVADTGEEGPAGRLVSTAPWGYLRLRRAEYGDADLDRWAEEIRAQGWERAFVFFKHEDEARGPELATRLTARFPAARAPG
jgi:uncharacterized protein YecE (DUF72 family)